MRLAAIADIHGNVLALQAVLTDIARRGADLTLDLGDCVSGPLWPRETFELLDTLKLPTVRGNWQRLAVRGNHDRALCDPPAGLGPSDRFAVSELAVVRDPGAWERLAVSVLPADAAKSLAALPPTLVPLPGVFACHGTPDNDEAYLLETVTNGTLELASPAAIAQRIAQVPEPLVLCAHSHQARIVQCGTQLIVNPGSVGCPAYHDPNAPAHVSETGTPHARYALLDDSSGAWSVELIAIPYDWARAADRARQNNRPEWAKALASGRLL